MQRVPKVVIWVLQITEFEEQDPEVRNEIALVETFFVPDDLRQIAASCQLRHPISSLLRAIGDPVLRIDRPTATRAGAFLVRHERTRDLFGNYTRPWTYASINQCALSRAREKAVNRSAVSTSPAEL
jgi:hypothetical protein